MDYQKSVEDVYKIHESGENGLTESEAKKRLAEHGPNKIKEGKKKSLIVKFLSQFKDVMIIVLIVAAILSAVIGIIENSAEEFIDCIIIIVIVLVNAIIGLVQENKAEAALEALKSMSTPYCKVLREGNVNKIKSEEIVKGDIVILEAGDIAPADIRLIEVASLKVQEAALTGESAAVDKTADTIPDEVPIGDRKNMVYSSGVVNYGRGRGIVTATAMDTEVGKIASMLNTKEEATPLQKKLDKTGKIISLGVVGIAIVIFLVSIFTSTATVHGNKYINSFMTAIAIAVAAIPEGLPAVVTIVMALGVTRLSKRNAIIRKLPAVETLGCTEIICSDKTGTLTLNKMTVKRIVTINKEFTEKINSDSTAAELINCMVLCNDTVMNIENGQIKTVGDPTETALIEYAYNQGINKTEWDKKFERVDEKPFDSVRKLMTTVNLVDGKKVIYTKGAADELLRVCEYVLDSGKVRKITEADKAYINKKNSEMAKSALRVLGYAMSESGEIEKSMIFIGLSGMIDPPRSEAKEAIKICRRAGMTAIMITGDHKDTATAIAKELDMIKRDSEVITGRELDAMSDEEYLKNIHKYKVYARVSPENKVRIVKAWKKQGKIVAMTGDGVNDAPSIKSADIGIGMGITGTDVTKSIADMVLTDDNFATIVVAVEEGRKIYNNIEKSIQFLLSANIAEVISLFIITIFFPHLSFLIPVQILWVNLVTDSFPALALGVEKSEKDIMDTPPRKSAGSLFAGRLGINILYQGLAQAIIVIVVFLTGNKLYGNAVATTMALVSLSLIQLFHSFNMRSNHTSIFKMPMFGNPMVWAAFGTGILLTLAVVGIPFLNPIFGTTPLNLLQWAIAILGALLIIPIVESGKLVERRLGKKVLPLSAVNTANTSENKEEDGNKEETVD